MCMSWCKDSTFSEKNHPRRPTNCKKVENQMPQAYTKIRVNLFTDNA